MHTGHHACVIKTKCQLSMKGFFPVFCFIPPLAADIYICVRSSPRSSQAALRIVSPVTDVSAPSQRRFAMKGGESERLPIMTATAH